MSFKESHRHNRQAAHTLDIENLQNQTFGISRSSLDSIAQGYSLPYYIALLISLYLYIHTYLYRFTYIALLISLYLYTFTYIALLISLYLYRYRYTLFSNFSKLIFSGLNIFSLLYSFCWVNIFIFEAIYR